MGHGSMAGGVASRPVPGEEARVATHQVVSQDRDCETVHEFEGGIPMCFGLSCLLP